MSRWDTPFYKNERYYDPTAGAAILSVIRSERQKLNDITENVSGRKDRKINTFALLFADFYGRSFGLRENGKPKRLAQYKHVYKLLNTYQYCVDHVDDKDFSVDSVVKNLRLGTDKTIYQVFSGRGNMGKLIDSYKTWMATGEICWRRGRKVNEQNVEEMGPGQALL